MVGIYRNNTNKVFFEGVSSSLLDGYRGKGIGLYKS